MKCQNLPSISFHTLGCKLNQAESEELCMQFARRGWNVVDGDSADVHVVNTCTVTHIADRKARGLLRSLRRANPQALIVATGCYVQRSADDLLKAGAGMLIDNEDKARLPTILADVLECGSSCCRAAADIPLQTRARSFVKIQDGCRQFCSYCIVPLVRSGELSLPAEGIIATIRDRVAQSYKEVVLTGTRIGSYRDGDTGLAALLRRILLETEIQRLHLSSLQPAEISAPLLELWSDSRLVQHFHLALQSGSASVLERMGRKYSPREY
ncbi:MAG TPA: radical SAM protein, partial [Dehalococcoidia bacterium]|nr:radical SAM protein [Dehalococcoidia bacterium]